VTGEVGRRRRDQVGLVDADGPRGDRIPSLADPRLLLVGQFDTARFDTTKSSPRSGGSQPSRTRAMFPELDLVR
jgi:hypothetical protein